MTETEKTVRKFMSETMPFTYKANNDGRLMTNLANFYDWLKQNEALAISCVSNWVAVKDKMPDELETVWISNGKGWTTLGCLVYAEGGWHWAETNGVIYQEDGKIVSECESDDLDVKFWHRLPEPPCL